MIQNKYKILLVEDESNIRNLVSTVLETSGYQTIMADTCSVAKTLFASYLPDLIILDLGLPDMDGINLLEFVRKDSLVPIIVLSARTNESDKIDALDKGANDYITKPFGSGELLARVRAALRNNRFSAEQGRLPGGRFTLKELEIDYDARRVFIKGEEIHLTQTEYNIVALLSENCGKMMTYATIIKAIWGGLAEDGSVKKLQVNMANIRKKFGDKPGETNYIANELGVGYRLNE
ncbi:MAG: response regulator transcription factor [Ruminococcaceae bacterium]|nr:response regulator transcription factor [Oscillospiraceae bacterium]MBQ8793398.1 response regulator transcription factor [Clostridia bacterium]